MDICLIKKNSCTKTETFQQGTNNDFSETTEWKNKEKFMRLHNFLVGLPPAVGDLFFHGGFIIII